MSGRPSMNVVTDDDLPFRIWVIRNYAHRILENRSNRSVNAFQAYLEDTWFSERAVHTPQPRPPTTRTSGLGLSEEKISKHLCVMKRNVEGKCEGEEVDSCAICLGEYEENEMIGRVECGHQFHAECIKGWLLCKNVCPLCRATALTI